MAITTTSIGINTGNASYWQGKDAIELLEKGFTWLGWNGEDHGGVAGITSVLGAWGNITADIGTNVHKYYHNVKPVSSSGIGTGASFYVHRYNGYVSELYVNNPGYGYTGGEVLQLSAEDYGGSANGATDVQIIIHTADTVSSGTTTVAIGLTGQYYATGEDRNGTVDGQGAAITIKEGDTLTITANQNSSSYNMNILWYANQNTTPSNFNRVWNVIGQNAGGNNNSTITWTPLPGQAGTYFLRDDSGSYGSVTPVIFVEPADSASITTSTYGSSSSFISKNLSPSVPYGVAKHTIDANKKYGTTYRAFGITGNVNLYTTTGTGFVPWTSYDFKESPENIYNAYSGGHVAGRRFTGIPQLDLGSSGNSWNQSYDTFAYADGYLTSYSSNASSPWTISNNINYQLNLNIYRSGIDPNFAVFSFMMPTISSTSISDRTFATFFVHNFSTSVWDLDYVFLGGCTRILAEPSSTSQSAPRITFRTYTNPSYSFSSYWYTNYREPAKRGAEFGYSGFDGTTVNEYIDDEYRSQAALSQNGTLNSRIYFRNEFTRSTNSNDARMDSAADFNAVIKGIPINGHLVPIPYYIPDDFVLIDFRYPLGGVNIQQGDTITVSPSEVYTVITGSYNQSGVTRGILFCARKV